MLFHCKDYERLKGRRIGGNYGYGKTLEKGIPKPNNSITIFY
jgi:hypothetical protein